MLVLSLVALGEYAGASTVLGAVLSDSASASSHLSDMKESLPHIEAFRNAVSGEEWEFAAGLLPKVEIFLKHSPLLLLSATVLLETGKAEEARAVLLPYVPSISPPPVLKGETILREEQMLRKNVESHFLLCNVLLAKASLYCGRLYINIAAELIQRCLQTNASFLPAMRVGNYIISLEDYISKYAEAMERKRYNLALDICEDALKLDAQNKKINATFHYERAQAFLHLQKPLSVIEECTQSLLHDPSVAKVYVTRAAALQDVMRFEEADLDRLMAIKLNRSYERVFNHRTGTKHSGTKANEKASKPEKFPWQVTLYDELGVTRDATTEVVKSTYKRLVLKYHPDKLTTEPKEVQKTAEEKFKKLHTRITFSLTNTVVLLTICLSPQECKT
ncbi:TPRcontaining chaperone protein DNAJ [Angomonas deanei]|uniref:DnaJ domain containing protein, putative n=1 Tax=Angomonas deanei TaxID=59799 RepID=A0A7G2C9W9_9TRYP|nr:TPRcontaining chaperone protein DNAJ [Angomonas deanei]CAD2214812.1 DnaJ domain containing protein, putative [Angomonas deanei]|eukprot:EPY34969.1 TPRcontaining chaperone protein DNAJ [Angomonas deanei]